jgi:hypothetical protein
VEQLYPCFNVESIVGWCHKSGKLMRELTPEFSVHRTIMNFSALFCLMRLLMFHAYCASLVPYPHLKLCGMSGSIHCCLIMWYMLGWLRCFTCSSVMYLVKMFHVLFVLQFGIVRSFVVCLTSYGWQIQCRFFTSYFCTWHVSLFLQVALASEIVCKYEGVHTRSNIVPV